MPQELSGTVTRFATVRPGGKLRLETTGIVIPSGKTVRNPEAVGSTAVTLSTTAAIPAGTGAVPTFVTCNWRGVGGKGLTAFGWPEFGLVS